MTLENKWIRGAIPALLLHVCIGTVYCWSLLKGEISSLMGCQVSSIEFAFSLAIFFLGMSAAFGGRFVERNVKKSSLLSCACFCTGLLGSVLAIICHSIPLLFLFYGCVMGIGLGLGYLSPVKTLMLWFSKHKGLATGIAISGFGLAKVVFSPFIVWCNGTYGVITTLISIAGISIVSMGLATYLIKKPDGWVETQDKFNLKEMLSIFKNKTFSAIWFVFFLNITCGLALIAFEKSIAQSVGIMNVGVLAALTAFFNTAGRFGYSTISDLMKDKSWIYIVIFASSVIASLLGIIAPYWIIIGLMLFVINAGYGGGFSTLPTLLQSKFGMERISMIHGLTLSAWAFAGLCGNQLSNLIINHLELPYGVLFGVLGLLYGLALFITVKVIKIKKEKI